jgi:ferredoxin
MKVKVTDDCILCGLCAEIAPKVFEMGDDKAELLVDPVPEEQRDLVEEAAESCPVAAIVIED